MEKTKKQNKHTNNKTKNAICSLKKQKKKKKQPKKTRVYDLTHVNFFFFFWTFKS